MTDLNERLDALLEGEPSGPLDLDRVVIGGRRAMRRRNTLVAVAGTAGTAAVTAAVIAPIAMNGSGVSGAQIQVLTQPTHLAPPRCKLYFEKAPSKAGLKKNVARLRKKVDRRHGDGTTINVKTYRLKPTLAEVSVCPPGATMPKNALPGEAPTTPAGPPYSYAADPHTIANGLGTELTKQVKALGFTVIYTSPFAQETSTLEKGHPSYFDGNVDVRLPDGPASIGVQVTHNVTALVPLDGDCNAPDCIRSKLADGSLMQVSHIDAGSDGAEVIAVEIHHADGLVVEAQESNYGFGPETTKARSSQPLTIDQLTTLAEDPAFAF